MRKAIVSPGAVVKANTDLKSLAKSIGRFVDGNKSATGASSGEFVVLLNSTISGRTDGLYTAAKAIPANTAIDSSYLTASSTGGLNALNDNLTAKINLGNTYVNSVSSLNTALNALTSAGSVLIQYYSSAITQLLTNDETSNGNGQVWFTRASTNDYQFALFLYNSTMIYCGRYNPSTSTTIMSKSLMGAFRRVTSTTSFQSIDPQNTSRSDYMGGTLDAKIHAQISTFTTDATTPFCASNGGPMYGGFLSKTNNNYYSGIVYSYHDSAQYSIWYFAYTNGTYHLRPCSPVMS